MRNSPRPAPPGPQHPTPQVEIDVRVVRNLTCKHRLPFTGSLVAVHARSITRSQRIRIKPSPRGSRSELG